MIRSGGSARGRPSTFGRILLAGLGLFAEHGFQGTSIRDIAAEAAVQSASLYTHFPSKEAILAELVLAGHEEHHTRLVAALLESGTDPRDRLAALVRAHVQAHTDYPMLAVVANNEPPSHHAVPLRPLTHDNAPRPKQRNWRPTGPAST